MEWLNQSNSDGDFDETIRKVEIPNDFFKDVQSALAELPTSVKKKISPKLIGVFIASGLVSSGITKLVINEEGE